MMMKKLFLLTTCFVFFGCAVIAQCPLTKSVVKGETKIETSQCYIYKRLDDQYFALSIKAITVKKANLKQQFFKVIFTAASNTGPAQNLIITLANNSSISLPLGKASEVTTNDNSQSNYTFKLPVNATNANKLMSLQVRSIGVSTLNGKSIVDIPLDDVSMLQHLLTCLKS